MEKKRAEKVSAEETVSQKEIQVERSNERKALNKVERSMA